MDKHVKGVTTPRRREEQEVYRSRLIGASLLGLGLVAWWTLQAYGLW